MSDTYPNALTGATGADDIQDDADEARAALDRRADAILADADARAFDEAERPARDFEPTSSLRQAVRDDLGQVRQLARARADRAREAIVDEPLKSAFYALGVGVLIGLLLRR